MLPSLLTYTAENSIMQADGLAIVSHRVLPSSLHPASQRPYRDLLILLARLLHRALALLSIRSQQPYKPTALQGITTQANGLAVSRIVSVMTAVSVVFPFSWYRDGYFTGFVPVECPFRQPRKPAAFARVSLYVDMVIPQGPGLVEYPLSTTPQRQRPMWGFLTLANWDVKSVSSTSTFVSWKRRQSAFLGLERAY